MISSSLADGDAALISEIDDYVEVWSTRSLERLNEGKIDEYNAIKNQVEEGATSTL
jgi:transcription initiation factor TFIID subunit TAF12